MYKITEVVDAYNRRNKTDHSPHELLDDLYNKRLLSAETIGAEHLYVNKYVIYRFLDEVGIKLRPKGRPVERTGYREILMNIPKEQLAEMRPKEIKAVVGCSGAYLTWMLSRLGLEYKRGRYKARRERVEPVEVMGRGVGELIDARCC